jgi:hypothetical protein
VKSMDSDNRKKITRSVFIKLGMILFLGLAAFGIGGCKDQSALAPRPNVPIPQMMNFVGNPSSKVFHKMRCRLAPPSNRGVFFDSPIAAKNAGFRPCYVCKPLDP